MEKKRLRMKKNLSIFFTILSLLIALSCKKDDSKIKYQDGYPDILAGNWVVFEFPNDEDPPILHDPYDLVTSIDPNNNGSLIFDKIYDSDTRIRAKYAADSFFVEMGPQLELVSTNTFDIAYVTLSGYVSQNPIIINAVYQYALSSFKNMAFTKSDIKDVILIHAAYFNKYQHPVQSALILGYRKTGFEDVKY